MVDRGTAGHEWILLAKMNVLIFSIRWVSDSDVKVR
jgi:hypothetical protein